jgi:hypothetical protein
MRLKSLNRSLLVYKRVFVQVAASVTSALPSKKKRSPKGPVSCAFVATPAECPIHHLFAREPLTQSGRERRIRPSFQRGLGMRLFRPTITVVIYLCVTATCQAGFVYSNGSAELFGTASTDPYGINNSGQIVGSNGLQGFVYSSGIFQSLSVPGALSTNARAINDLGQVAGFYFSGGNTSGFIYSGGTFTTLNVPGATNTHLLGINNAGLIIGNFSTGGDSTPFLYSAGTFTTLPQDPSAKTSTDFVGINNNGQMVGFYDGTHPFLYSSGSFTNLPQPSNSISALPMGINDNGQIAGYYLTSTNIVGFIDTSGIYNNLIFGNDTLLAQGINNDGVIVGNLLAGSPAVPEPSTWAMLLIGFAAMGWTKRQTWLRCCIYLPWVSPGSL